MAVVWAPWQQRQQRIALWWESILAPDRERRKALRGDTGLDRIPAWLWFASFLGLVAVLRPGAVLVAERTLGPVRDAWGLGSLALGAVLLAAALAAIPAEILGWVLGRTTGIGRPDPIARRCRAEQRKPGPLDTLAFRLRTGDWETRLVACHGLAARGPEAIPALASIALQRGHPGRPWAARVLEPLAHHTHVDRVRLRTLVCPRCLVRYRRTWIPVHGLRWFRVDGCARCHGTESPLHCPGEVIAVLDRRARRRIRLVRGTLAVSWFHGRPAADYDRVTILDASDRDVEGFAIQAANEPDRRRRRRHRRAPVQIAPGCALGENTRRVLRATFAGIETAP